MVLHVVSAISLILVVSHASGILIQGSRVIGDRSSALKRLIFQYFKTDNEPVNKITRMKIIG